jgi:hypothetical protein
MCVAFGNIDGYFIITGLCFSKLEGIFDVGAA